MTIEAWIVLAILALTLAGLMSSKLPTDVILLGALTAVVAVPVPGPDGVRAGLLPVEQAFVGFSNTGMLTVGVLFVVVAGLRETGAVDWLVQSLLGTPHGLRGALARLTLPVAAMSAFLNNTPIVAMMIPAVNDWCKKLEQSPSKLMLPLSYAAILGGTCSLIGTSTNLVVNGLIIAEGMPSLGMFDITWVGLPSALVGLAFLLVAGPWLLPDRKSAVSRLSNPREYTSEMLVPEDSPLVGKTVREAGLRHLPGAYLVEVNRGSKSVYAVSPEEVIQAGDRMLFAGVVDSIRDLQNLRGLLPATDQIFKLDSPRYRRRLFEAVVSSSCPLVGLSIRAGRFRNRYGAAVIAVARDGHRLTGRVGDIVLEPGDTLLLEARTSFLTQYRYSRDFLLITSLADSTPRRHHRAPTALAILAVMVGLVTWGAVSMLVGALLAAGAMILTRCCSVGDARRSVDWPVLVVIACALGLGEAIASSGLAHQMAGAALGTTGGRPWAVLIALYLITWLLTEILTNNAAVALVFPIALEASRQLGLEFLPFAMVLMMAGSASFSTPLGYQTNLMVYGPGGYRFSDYLRLGVPMSLVVGAVAITVTLALFRL